MLAPLDDARATMSLWLLGAGRSIRLRAFGVSMAPTIRSGEALRVEPVAKADVRVGDILLCRPQRALVVHRVRRVEIERFYLEGETAGYGEEFVAAETVLGRVTAVERGGEWIALANVGPSQRRRFARRWRNFLLSRGAFGVRKAVATAQRLFAARS